MSSSLPSKNPTGYLGVTPTYPGQIYFKKRAPINNLDVHNYLPGDTWINTASNAIWMLTKIVNQPPPLTKVANWEQISGAGAPGIGTLTGDIGGAVGPAGGNVNVVGLAAQGIVTDGTLAANTLTIEGIDATTLSKGVAQFSPLYFTTAAGVVSINDASTIAKGVAQFDPTYFVTALGVVSLTGNAGFRWAATAGPQVLTPNRGWIAANAAGTLFTLPAVSAQGDVVAIVGQGAAGWFINQAAGQQIIVSSTVQTTAGVAGSIVSSDAYDAIYLVCYTANTIWIAFNIKGNVLVI